MFLSVFFGEIKAEDHFLRGDVVWFGLYLFGLVEIHYSDEFLMGQLSYNLQVQHSNKH